MADRILGSVTLVITIFYGFYAFFVIKAPFQYDPLGPESWPKILTVVAGLCSLYILVRPDGRGFKVPAGALGRIGQVAALLVGYAFLFEPFGFILSTTLFCGVLAKLLGATYVRATGFGIGFGVIGYLLCAKLLALNLPGGWLSKLL